MKVRPKSFHLPKTVSQRATNTVTASELNAEITAAVTRKSSAVDPIETKGSSDEMAVPGRYHTPHRIEFHKPHMNPQRMARFRWLDRAALRSPPRGVVTAMTPPPPHR